MGQCWVFVNVDKWVALPGWKKPKVRKILVSRMMELVISFLAVDDFKEVPPPSESELRRTRAHNSSSRIVNIPQEIFDAILVELSNPADVLRVALTCSFLWRALRPQVKEAIRMLYWPWAGDRLVLVGDYAEGVPPSCQDYEKADGYRLPECAADGYVDGPEFSNPLYNIISWTLGFERSEVCDGPDKELFWRLLDGMRRHPGSKRPGVLRNLSKKQYILDSKLAESEYTYSLGEAMAMRTFWTECRDGTNGGLSDWAGDRFDIRSIEDVPEGWTDVSDETIDLLNNATGGGYFQTDDKKKGGLRAWVG